MTRNCHKKLKKIWQALGGKALPRPIAKRLEKTRPSRDHSGLFQGPSMKPLNYFQQIVRMPDKADKLNLRLPMVQDAIADGIKPTVRVFQTTAKTVRKWLGRYHQEGLTGLNELPRIALHCPHKSPPLPQSRCGE